MRKKNIIGILGLIICIMIIQISPIRGVNFIQNDGTDDVYFISDYTTISRDLSVYPEIDIVSIEIDGADIVITFGDPPVVADSYTYEFKLYWIGDDSIGNWTDGTLHDYHNYVQTRIENSTGGVILDETENDIIDVVGDTLVIPLTYITLITTTLALDPRFITIYTKLRIDSDNTYNDDLIYQVFPLPGFNFWITIIGIASITIIGLLIKRKKN